MMTADTYKVTYKVFGSYHIYGYADTLEDAMILEEECLKEGWLYRKISHWDEETMTWNVLQESTPLHDRWAEDDEPFRIVEEA